MKTVKNKPKIYGLTGGIASGKSVAAGVFESLNVKIFDSDFYVKKLWEENDELIKKVNEKYNIDITKRKGKDELSNIIFNNELDRFYINSLVHPLVFEGVEKFIKDNIKEPFIIIDMPLLFEVGYENKVDKTILIYTNKRNQINRLMKRDNISKKEALLKINSQIKLKDKRKMSHFVINNNKKIEDLKNKVKLLYEVLKNES